MVHALCNRWQAEGLSVILATDSADAAPRAPVHGTPLSNDVLLFANSFPNPLDNDGHIGTLLRRAAQYASGARAFWGLLRRRRVDLVHLHMVNLDALLLAAFKPIFGYRLVLTFTGLELELAHESLLSRLKLRLALAAADLVTTVSEDIGSRLQAETGRSSRYVPNGVELPVTPGGARSLTEPGHYVFCGRLAPVKRVPFLIDAYAEAVRAGCRRHLYILGAGAEETTVRDRIARYGLADRVVMVGEVDPADAVEAMRHSWCVVLASASEGQPIAVLEAMLVGRPVIAPDIGGIREIVEDGVTGWLFGVDDRAALSALLARLDVDSPSVAQAAARSLAAAGRFGFERMAKAYLQVYDDALSDARASPSVA